MKLTNFAKILFSTLILATLITNVVLAYSAPPRPYYLDQQTFDNSRQAWAVAQVEAIQKETKKKEEQAKPVPQTIEQGVWKPTQNIQLSGNVVNRINQVRANAGKPPVTESAELNASALAHSNRMASGYGHNHGGFSGEVIGYSCGYMIGNA